jgi:hypothetical protein
MQSGRASSGHRHLVRELKLRPPMRRDIDLNHSADEFIRAMHFDGKSAVRGPRAANKRSPRCAAEAVQVWISDLFAKPTRLKNVSSRCVGVSAGDTEFIEARVRPRGVPDMKRLPVSEQ